MSKSVASDQDLRKKGELPSYFLFWPKEKSVVTFCHFGQIVVLLILAIFLLKTRMCPNRILMSILCLLFSLISNM